VKTVSVQCRLGPHLLTLLLVFPCEQETQINSYKRLNKPCENVYTESCVVKPGPEVDCVNKTSNAFVLKYCRRPFQRSSNATFGDLVDEIASRFSIPAELVESGTSY
jgi:hypothetical protein